MPGMKNRTIKTVIRKKIDHFLSTFPEGSLKEAIKRDIFVTGGCITSMLLGEKINDYDVYFKSFDTAKKVAEYYVIEFNANARLRKQNLCAEPFVQTARIRNIKGEMEDRILIWIQSAGVTGEVSEPYRYFESEPDHVTEEYVETLSSNITDVTEALIEDSAHQKNKWYRPVFLTDNAITLSDKVQLIIRFYGTPEEVHRNYDFVHTLNYYDYAKDELVLKQEALESIISKSLIYQGSLYPLTSMFRIRKFVERGWRITAGQMLKIAMQLSETPLHEPYVLQDQLMGVDAAYMHQLLSLIKSTDEKIDSAYIMKLVDQIFE